MERQGEQEKNHKSKDGNDPLLETVEQVFTLTNIFLNFTKKASIAYVQSTREIDRMFLSESSADGNGDAPCSSTSVPRLEKGNESNDVSRVVEYGNDSTPSYKASEEREEDNFKVTFHAEGSSSSKDVSDEDEEDGWKSFYETSIKEHRENMKTNFDKADKAFAAALKTLAVSTSEKSKEFENGRKESQQVLAEEQARTEKARQEEEKSFQKLKEESVMLKKIYEQRNKENQEKQKNDVRKMKQLEEDFKKFK